MIVLPFIAVALGFAVFYGPMRGFEADETVARYMAIAVLAGLDTVLGGVRAWWDEQFDDAVFISGFFVNSLLAAGLVAMGERLGLETGFGDQRISVMMVAAVVVFSTRIFNNLAALRRMIIERWRAQRRTSQNSLPSTLDASGSEASTSESTLGTPSRVS
jgi:small basic protein